jgi:hypothetical protein
MSGRFLRQFHVNVYAMPTHTGPGPRVAMGGRTLETLRIKTFDAFLPVTFEQAVGELCTLPRMDAEPDGFFVVAGEHEGRRWQIDGHLFDFGDRLHRVELHGECPVEALDALLACFGWPKTTLAFELVMEGVALDEAAFRESAAAESQ